METPPSQPRPRRRTGSRGARAALVALLALSACPGNGKPAPRASDLPTGGGVAGGTLRVLLNEDVDSLDPQRAGAPSSWSLVRAMHRGLMAYPAEPAPEGSKPVPDLAEAAPTVSADGLTYTFRLRGGVAFGAPASRPVRAADVKAGIERIRAVKAPVATYFGVVAGVDAPDDRTVVIRLSRPANDLLWLLALPQASAIPAGTDPLAHPEQIAASGPYRLADRDGYLPERSIHLVRNAAWKADSDPIRHAWVDEIAVTIGLDAKEIQRRLIAGEADLSGDAGPVQPEAAPAERLTVGPGACLRYVFMNTRVAPFQTAAVRLAVASAVDRKPIAAIEGSGAAPAATILPEIVDGHDTAAAAPSADPDGAARALAAAGFPKGITATLVVGDTARDRAEAAALKAALGKALVAVTVRTMPIASLYEDGYEVPATNIGMGIATWCADWPGLAGRGGLAPLVDGRAPAARGNTNYAALRSPSLQALLDRAAVERDASRAAELWLSADAAAVRLAGVVPLVHLGEVSLLGPRVKGFLAHPFYVRGDFTAVWLDAGPGFTGTPS